MQDEPERIVLYDGVCRLCNESVAFIIKRDRHRRFRFAPLGSEVGDRMLAAQGVSPTRSSSIYLVIGRPPGGAVFLTKSDAVIEIAKHLSGPWPLIGRLWSVVPRWLRNLLYEAIAATRYRLFGRHESCPVPPPEWRERFL